MAKHIQNMPKMTDKSLPHLGLSFPWTQYCKCSTTEKKARRCWTCRNVGLECVRCVKPAGAIVWTKVQMQERVWKKKWETRSPAARPQRPNTDRKPSVATLHCLQPSVCALQPSSIHFLPPSSLPPTLSAVFPHCWFYSLHVWLSVLLLVRHPFVSITPGLHNSHLTSCFAFCHLD